jgi:membrane associated rhomboid family serine protease
LYFFAGIAGMIAHIMTNPQSTVPAIGASGAIAGILGAYILLFPRARIRSVLFLIIIFQIVELPAVIVVGLWAVLQVFDAIALAGANMGVAVFAHLGGFVFGCAFIELFKGRRP